jgi:hypothetical protein
MFRLGVVCFLGGKTEDEKLQRKTCATILTAEEPYSPVGENKCYGQNKMHYIFGALAASKRPAHKLLLK